MYAFKLCRLVSLGNATMNAKVFQDTMSHLRGEVITDLVCAQQNQSVWCQDDEIELFARFFDGTYDTDDLSFFLHGCLNDPDTEKMKLSRLVTGGQRSWHLCSMGANTSWDLTMPS